MSSELRSCCMDFIPSNWTLLDPRIGRHKHFASRTSGSELCATIVGRFRDKENVGWVVSSSYSFFSHFGNYCWMSSIIHPGGRPKELRTYHRRLQWRELPSFKGFKNEPHRKSSTKWCCRYQVNKMIDAELRHSLDPQSGSWTWNNPCVWSDFSHWVCPFYALLVPPINC